MSLLTSPKKPNLKIIFEDDSLVVIDKPSGVVVNISESSPENTIQNELQKTFSGKDSGAMGFEFSKRTGVVHRLDKDTSGVLIAAKNEESFFSIKNQFKERLVKKHYIALVFGELEDPIVEVDAPIARNPKNRIKMAIVDGGRNAESRFELDEVIDYGDEKLSVVNCYPTTGRTHQLRVHLAAMKHPIVADPIYMTRKQFTMFEQDFERLMLHAWKIQFNHPKTNNELSFEAPLPKVFIDICSKPH
ncbi:RluA family pseudouridine synthase [Patescibacteria group bacterium]